MTRRLTPIKELPEAARPLAGADHAVTSALAYTDPDELRKIALWAADLALTLSGTRSLPWVDTTMTALYRGHPAPTGQDPRAGRFLTTPEQFWAARVLEGAADPDPLTAAYLTLGHAGHAPGADLEWVMGLAPGLFPTLAASVSGPGSSPSRSAG
ncbi:MULTISPECIES: hypothetical protein [Actinoplanes]|uniref:hypothetical protein n=1 Tax=Actinoplanes TaxID=1865 RepID=UPI0005F2B9B1|nr:MULTISPECIES: hypothetical protein [Actinoplanes]